MHTNREDLHISWTISGNDDDDPELNDRDEYVYNLAGWLEDPDPDPPFPTLSV